MSTTVSSWLSEIAERGEQRRSRITEVRQRSSLAMDVLHHIEWKLNQQARIPFKGETLSPAGIADDAEREDRVDPVEQAPEVDVLQQVQQLLVEVSERERDIWNEDDALILIHLQEVWAAATRRGYTLEEVKSILQALTMPDREGGGQT